LIVADLPTLNLTDDDPLGRLERSIFIFGHMKIFMPKLAPIIRELVAFLEQKLIDERDASMRAAAEAEIARLRRGDINSFVHHLCEGAAKMALNPNPPPDRVQALYSAVKAAADIRPGDLREVRTRAVAHEFWRLVITGSWSIAVMNGRAALMPAPAKGALQ
jgi:hypothetical protein